MFKLSWLPEFYFIYWIAILAIIAITHEFAHGIFAAYHKIKVKKTGFGFFPYFLPVFLAAFVELDEERMQKEKIFKQLSILSAGTFANVLTAIISFALMAGFFILAFSPSGVVFSNYAYNQVNWSEVNITHINGQEIENYNANLSITDSMNISTTSGEYILNLYSLENNSMQVGEDFISILYYNSPALNANLSGAITEINNEKIYSLDKLDKEISKYNISDKIKVKTILDGKENEYELTLEESPFNSSKPWLGVAFQLDQESSSLGKIIQKANSYKDSNVYYTTRFGESSNFIYNLLWWLFLISVSVAIVNMLPVGIFDGGRFFYLTILYLTKIEKIAKKSFAVMTYLFLLLIIAIMILWAKSFF
jgi:membrane-associated protease RseP (regulator of RpoE activity)